MQRVVTAQTSTAAVTLTGDTCTTPAKPTCFLSSWSQAAFKHLAASCPTRTKSTVISLSSWGFSLEKSRLPCWRFALCSAASWPKPRANCGQSWAAPVLGPCLPVCRFPAGRDFTSSKHRSPSRQDLLQQPLQAGRPHQIRGQPRCAADGLRQRGGAEQGGQEPPARQVGVWRRRWSEGLQEELGRWPWGDRGPQDTSTPCGIALQDAVGYHR